MFNSWGIETIFWFRYESGIAFYKKKTSYSSRARRHHNYMKKTIYLEVVNIHIKSAEEPVTSSVSSEESAGAFYYFVINFVSLKPTGVLVPSERFPIKG